MGVVAKPWTNYHSRKVPRPCFIPSRNTCLANELVDKGKYDNSSNRFRKLNKQHDEYLPPWQGRYVPFFTGVLQLSVRVVFVKCPADHLLLQSVWYWSETARLTHGQPFNYHTSESRPYSYNTISIHKPELRGTERPEFAPSAK